MEHDQRYSEAAPFVPHHGHWPEAPGYHPHHHAPPHEYSGALYGYGADPGYGGPPAHSLPRSSHPQLQPLVVPAHWPHVQAGQAPYTPYLHTSAPAFNHSPVANPPISHPQSAPPQLPSSNSKQHTPTPRKTLSEVDRRKMCFYAEENPNKKQTEIGVVFGVERSTVSKVLRQKDRYIGKSDGSRSPAKKPRAKFPDIDRALMNWVKNQETRGYKMTDEMIREQAKFFSSATRGGADVHANINSAKWLNEFKRRNNIGGNRSRKSSFRAQKPPTVLSRSSHETLGSTSGMSPASTTRLATPSMTDLSSGGSPSVMQHHLSGHHNLYHSQSNNSLSSNFGTDGTPPAAFSGEHTPADSPFFAAATLNGDGQHEGVLHSSARNAGTALQRSRSQTFPIVSAGPAGYISPPASSLTGTPKFVSSNLVVGSSPSEGMPPPPSKPSRPENYPHQQQIHNPQLHQYHHQTDPPHELDQQIPNYSITSCNSSPLSQFHQSTEPQQPQSQSNDHVYTQISTTPPSHIQALPAPSPSPPTPPSNHPSDPLIEPQPPPQPSQDEARAALEIVKKYLENQTPGAVNASGVAIEPNEFVMIGTLIERLKMQHTPASAPAQLHRVGAADRAYFREERT